MKKIFSLLMAAFAVLCVCSSCSNDDEGNGETNYAKSIVGTWELDKQYYVESNSYEDNEKTIAEFKSNGKVFMSYDDGSSAVINWRIVNSSLYLEEGDEKEVHTIKKLDSKEMVLSTIDGSSEVIAYFVRLK